MKTMVAKMTFSQCVEAGIEMVRNLPGASRHVSSSALARIARFILTNQGYTNPPASLVCPFVEAMRIRWEETR